MYTVSPLISSKSPTYQNTNKSQHDFYPSYKIWNNKISQTFLTLQELKESQIFGSSFFFLFYHQQLLITLANFLMKHTISNIVFQVFKTKLPFFQDCGAESRVAY